MVKNIGIIDRVFRVVSGIIIFALISAGSLNGAAAIVLGVIGAVLALTAFIGTCPIYLGLGLSTNRETKAKSQNI